jgi:hypothetical protein
MTVWGLMASLTSIFGVETSPSPSDGWKPACGKGLTEAGNPSAVRLARPSSVIGATAVVALHPKLAHTTPEHQALVWSRMRGWRTRSGSS